MTKTEAFINMKEIEGSSSRHTPETLKKSLFTPSSVACLIGLSTYLSWTISRINTTLLPPSQEGTHSILMAADTPHSLAYIVVLLIFFLWSYKGKTFVSRKLLAVVLSVAVSASTVLTYLAGWGEHIIVLGLWVGLISSALEMGIFLLWGEIYSSMPFRQACVHTALAYASAFAICLVQFQLKGDAIFFVHACMPLVSGFILYACTDVYMSRDRNFTKRSISSLPWRFFIGFGCLAFLLLLASDLSEHLTSYTTQLQSLTGGLIGSAVFAIVALALSWKMDLSMVYRCLPPFLVVCLVLLLVAQPGTTPYEIYAIASCWAFFRISVWLMWCYLQNKLRVAPILVFAGGQLVLTFGGLIEKIMKQSVVGLNDPLVPIVVIIIVLTLAVSTFLLGERHISRMFSTEGAHHLNGDALLIETSGENLKTAGEQEVFLDSHSFRLMADRYQLTQREEEVVFYVIQGKENEEIENRLFIAPSTLKTHLRNIYSKCGVHSRRELIHTISSQLNDKDTFL